VKLLSLSGAYCGGEDQKTMPLTRVDTELSFFSEQDLKIISIKSKNGKKEIIVNWGKNSICSC
jgi:hypothetical protein